MLLARVRPRSIWLLLSWSKDKLEAHGVAVGMTRYDESNPSLYKRYTVTNTMRADLFVSIHCNSAASDKATGTEVWIRRDDASDRERQIAERLSSKVASALGIVSRGVKQVPDKRRATRQSLPGCNYRAGIYLQSI